MVEHREDGAWGSARVVLEADDRECGAVRAIATGTAVAATVECDEHYAEDQAPTASVALVSRDLRSWSHHDLSGEAYGTPGLSPDGTHAVWTQTGDLLTWDGEEFGTTDAPDQDAQVVTVDDSGDLALLTTGRAGGRCTVDVEGEGGSTVVPVADADLLQCDELGLSLADPSEVRGDVSGQPGTQLVVRRDGATAWTLASPAAITMPGLDTYPDDRAVAIWNQVTANTRGDLVAVGSPDRQHLTAQRYDPARQRWTPSRVVHDAGAPVCRRSTLDSGILQGRTFELRIVCGGKALVLRSSDGRTWTS